MKKNAFHWSKSSSLKSMHDTPQLNKLRGAFFLLTTKVTQRGWKKVHYIKPINFLLSLRGETGVSVYNILLINDNTKKRSKCLAIGCLRDPFSPCALCPPSVLCYLFWCFNLCQVNNILCCLKLCVRNIKASSFCWKYLSVTFHSLSDSQIE